MGSERSGMKPCAGWAGVRDDLRPGPSQRVLGYPVSMRSPGERSWSGSVTPGPQPPPPRQGTADSQRRGAALCTGPMDPRHVSSLLRLNKGSLNSFPGGMSRGSGWRGESTGPRPLNSTFPASSGQPGALGREQAQSHTTTGSVGQRPSGTPRAPAATGPHVSCQGFQGAF